MRCEKAASGLERGREQKDTRTRDAPCQKNKNAQRSQIPTSRARWSFQTAPGMQNMAQTRPSVTESANRGARWVNGAAQREWELLDGLRSSLQDAAPTNVTLFELFDS